MVADFYIHISFYFKKFERYYIIVEGCRIIISVAYNIYKKGFFVSKFCVINELLFSLNSKIYFSGI